LSPRVLRVQWLFCQTIRGCETSEFLSNFEKLKGDRLTDHDIALEVESGTCDDAEWAVIVALHLLSPLTVDGSYTIDDSYDNLTIKPGASSCPCKTGEHGDGEDGDFDDTSFGWIDGWHGKSDILMNNVSVHLANVEDDNFKVGSSAVSSSESSPETKTSNHQEQVFAQSIVFSFRGNLRHSLVPTIGISKKKIVIYFYDSEEDVLLGTTELDLFGYKSTICYDTIDETGWTKSGAVEEKIPINADNEDFGIRMKSL
ncbi:hypothetical protein AM593_09565, partial [Mytilus galloprovincialis]